MRLSISSSKNHFITQTIIAFITITICYYSIVSYMTKDFEGATQWQTNILKAQAYVFSEKYYPVVLAGSSEFCGIHAEELSDNVFNLAFAGGGASTGICIIMRQMQLPKTVVIEVNDTLMRQEDTDLLQETSLWHLLPWGRENNRPDYMLFHLMTQIRKAFHHGKSDSDIQTNLDMLKMRQKSHQNLLDEEVFKAKAMNLRMQVDILKQKGCRVILAEPPNDISLLCLPQTRQRQRILQEVFPADCYEWFIVDWNGYTTTDGIHLGTESSRRYAQQLLAYIE